MAEFKYLVFALSAVFFVKLYFLLVASSGIAIPALSGTPLDISNLPDFNDSNFIEKLLTVFKFIGAFFFVDMFILGPTIGTLWVFLQLVGLAALAKNIRG